MNIRLMAVDLLAKELANDNGFLYLLYEKFDALHQKLDQK
jgi:hypothetical protein